MWPSSGNGELGAGSVQFSGRSREMDWEKVEIALGRSFRAQPKHVASGIVVHRRKPLPLAAILESARPLEEREDPSSFESWPGNVSEVLNDFGAEESLLGFYW